MKMERTRNRSLPTGRLTPKVVLWYAIILGIVGLAMLFLFSGVLAGIFERSECSYTLWYTHYG